jgi:hypothetical protein
VPGLALDHELVHLGLEVAPGQIRRQEARRPRRHLARDLEDLAVQRAHVAHRLTGHVDAVMLFGALAQHPEHLGDERRRLVLPLARVVEAQRARGGLHPQERGRHVAIQGHRHDRERIDVRGQRVLLGHERRRAAERAQEAIDRAQVLHLLDAHLEQARVLGQHRQPTRPAGAVLQIGPLGEVATHIGVAILDREGREQVGGHERVLEARGLVQEKHELEI